jgi:hypothetical protein
MNGNGARSWRAGLLIVATVVLGGCGHHRPEADNGGGDGLHAYPANYKVDILAAMRTYLNDPSGIHDAAISEPMIKSIAYSTRYVVCLRFNGKQSNGTYAGPKQIAAEFLAGRFDDFVDTAAAHTACADAVYAPFPELEKLPR